MVFQLTKGRSKPGATFVAPGLKFTALLPYVVFSPAVICGYGVSFLRKPRFP